MPNAYSLDHTVLFYETEMTGQMGIGRLVDLLLLASEGHSDSLGVGSQEVQKLGLGWVITQHQLKVKTLPQRGQKVTVKTQAQNYNSFFCYRDFWLYDEAGQEMASMHSVFVLMDQEKRKMTRILPEIVAPFEVEKTKKVERLAQPQVPANPSNQKNYRVRFMDIDENRHVNNVHYFDWMLDSLEADFLLNHQLIEMNIVYKNEVHYGQEVTSIVQVDDSTTYHEIRCDATISCLAECKWQTR